MVRFPDHVEYLELIGVQFIARARQLERMTGGADAFVRFYAFLTFDL